MSAEPMTVGEPSLASNLTFAVLAATVDKLQARAPRRDPSVLVAGRAEPGRIYKVWSEGLGQVVKGERIGRGLGRWREHVFFRGDVGRGDDRRTVVVSVHQDDNVKFVPPSELAG